MQRNDTNRTAGVEQGRHDRPLHMAKVLSGLLIAAITLLIGFLAADIALISRPPDAPPTTAIVMTFSILALIAQLIVFIALTYPVIFGNDLQRDSRKSAFSHGLMIGYAIPLSLFCLAESGMWLAALPQSAWYGTAIMLAFVAGLIGASVCTFLTASWWDVPIETKPLFWLTVTSSWVGYVVLTVLACSAIGTVVSLFVLGPKQPRTTEFATALAALTYFGSIVYIVAAHTRDCTKRIAGSVAGCALSIALYATRQLLWISADVASMTTSAPPRYIATIVLLAVMIASIFPVLFLNFLKFMLENDQLPTVLASSIPIDADLPAGSVADLLKDVPRQPKPSELATPDETSMSKVRVEPLDQPSPERAEEEFLPERPLKPEAPSVSRAET